MIRTSTVAMIVALVLLTVLTVGMYVHLSNKVALATQQAQSLQQEKDDLNKNLEEKEKELASLKETASLTDAQLSRKATEIRRLQENIGVVGTCLGGVLQALNAASNNDGDSGIIALLAVVGPCKQSAEIIKEVENSTANDELLEEEPSAQRTAFRQ